MPAGSVLVYSGSVIHGGGATRTDRARIGVLLHCTLNWLGQEENQYISCPPPIAKDLDPELRALMGYANHMIMSFCSLPFGPGEGGEIVSPQSIFKGDALGWPGL